MLLHEELTEEIIYAFYKVYNYLGYGFLEKVYENAMVIQLNKQGIFNSQQCKVDVFYENTVVGLYFADLIADKKVIIEIKAVDSIAIEHEYQLLNYLKATNMEVGILLNFGKKPEFKRKVFTNNKKSFDDLI